MRSSRKKTPCLLIERGAIRGLPPEENAYRIEFVTPNGMQVMWCGPTYDAALAAAKWIARGELRIVDAVGGAI